jgi:molybdenum cofactor biosynthesis enzyme MoaA
MKAQSTSSKSGQAASRAHPAPPLFVAVHSVCNLTCWYCTEHGENRTVDGRLASAGLIEILSAAYATGVRTFRLTGGEPTLRHDVGVLLDAIQALGDDVRIAITTNGVRLKRLMPVLRTLHEPRIFLSVDGFSTDAPCPQGSLHIEKWLTPELRRTVDELAGFARVRFNFVLTRSSAGHLPPLIDYATDRGVDLKIFELLLRDFYYAGGRPPDEVFREQYVSVRTILPELRERFGQARPFGGTGGRGIPMYAFRHGRSRIIYFDSHDGSHYGDTCDRCPYYPCQEGLYALLLDVNGMLHPAGCENRELYIPLANASPADALAAFDRLQSVLEEASLRPVLPSVLACMAPVA